MENIDNIIIERLYQIGLFFLYVFLIIILFHVIIVLATSPNKKEDKKRKHNLSEKSNFNYVGTDKLYPGDLLYFGKKTKKKITRKKETVLNLIKDNNQLTKTKRKKSKLKGNTKKTKEDNLKIFKDNFLKKAN